MLFALIGCSRFKTPEQAAQRHLEKKYGGSFTVNTLTRKDNGTFLTSGYSGFAISKEEEDYPFKVWVEKDLRTVHDCYYYVSAMRDADEWLLSQAQLIWEDCKVRDVMECLRYKGEEASYQNLEQFLDSETFENKITLVLPAEYSKDPGLEEQYCRFSENIAELGFGTVRLFFTDNVSDSDVYALRSSQEYAAMIPMGVSRESIHNRFVRMWGNQ